VVNFGAIEQSVTEKSGQQWKSRVINYQDLARIGRIFYGTKDSYYSIIIIKLSPLKEESFMTSIPTF
jgi:hypothetical protein